MKRLLCLLLLVTATLLVLDSQVSAASYRFPISQVAKQTVLVVKKGDIAGQWMLVPVRRLNTPETAAPQLEPQILVIP